MRDERCQEQEQEQEMSEPEMSEPEHKSMSTQIFSSEKILELDPAAGDRPGRDVSVELLCSKMAEMADPGARRWRGADAVFRRRSGITEGSISK